ncbi:50S ribosomal protein L10 [Henriciella aquimarina]|uniref:50S ribosomal protein L10 n=1 Tax=Henriciella aquimarina TaxID=545261 RepID=UPI0009FC603F|nr:50S ribosomal protein L10 [Henriciella aquimarina]
MDRAGKQAALAELEEVFENSGAVVVTHYTGLSVAEMTGLRAKLREQGGRLKVVKNRIAKIALRGKGGDAATDLFSGQVAIAYAEDPTVPAKATAEFAKDNEKLKLIGAVMGAEVMDGAGVEALAKMPSREELIATIVARLTGQASEVVQRINAPGQQLAGAINVIGEKAAA